MNNMELKTLSNNWKKLQGTLQKESGTKRKSSEHETGHRQHGLKRRKTETTINKNSDRVGKPLRWKRMSEDFHPEAGNQRGSEPSTRRNSTASSRTAQPREGQVNGGLSVTAEIGKYVAIDCEMVGVGPNPDKESVLARVSIVNWNGDQIYDSFVRPKETVTDWRTFVSGISPKDMTDARSFEEVQRDVSQILDGTILVGHAVRNDLDALLLSHPKHNIRDTSKHPPYRKIAGGGSPRLKVLASEFLGLKIQEGAHSSVEDARATMLLFRRDKDEFDRNHAKKWPVRAVPVVMDGDPVGDKPAKKKKKNKKKGRKR